MVGYCTDYYDNDDDDDDVASALNLRGEQGSPARFLRDTLNSGDYDEDKNDVVDVELEFS